VSRDSDPSLSSSSFHIDGGRAAILSEKLQQAEQQHAEQRSQIASLEAQLAQMTQRVHQLQQLHASSAAELVEQTKHACEAAAARQTDEAAQQHQHDLSNARQSAAAALEQERTFTASLLRKVETMVQLFPARVRADGVSGDAE